MAQEEGKRENATLRPNLWEGKEGPRVSEGWSGAWQGSPELGHPLTGHYPSNKTGHPHQRQPLAWKTEEPS